MCKNEKILKINGEIIPVTEEVYLEYMRPVWREKKRQAKRCENEWSYEKMKQDDAYFELEDKNAVVEKIVEDKLLLTSLYKALDCLTDEERYIIDEIYFRGKSERILANDLGLSQKAVNKRKKKIIEKIKNKF